MSKRAMKDFRNLFVYQATRQFHVNSGRVAPSVLRWVYCDHISKVFLLIVGLDTAEEHRLLDQRGVLRIKCLVASLHITKSANSIILWPGSIGERHQAWANGGARWSDCEQGGLRNLPE